MILDKLLALYDTEPDLRKRRAPGRGNPTASSVGNCLAQQQMLRYPEMTQPEMRPIRTAWVFEDGDMHAAEMRAKVERIWPGKSGLQEELFYFRVPVTAEQAETLGEKIAARRLWGTEHDGFLPPFIRAGGPGEKDRMRLAPRDTRDPLRPRQMGFVLDRAAGVLWAPCYVDHVLRYEDGELAVIEYKSMSRFGFRRLLLGDPDLSIRMQLAVLADATGLPCVWFIKCKDTSHRLEAVFRDGQTETDVELVTMTKAGPLRRRYRVPKPGASAINLDTGEVVEQLPDDWDVGGGIMPSPHDAGLLDQARARVLRVLLFEPPVDERTRLLAWDREYAPDFRCVTCEGTGTQALTKQGREGKGRQILKGGPKPCPDCGQTGQIERAPLDSYPCGYCPVKATCYPMAVLEVGEKPVWWVTREEWDLSGITLGGVDRGTPGGQGRVQ